MSNESFTFSGAGPGKTDGAFEEAWTAGGLDGGDAWAGDETLQPADSTFPLIPKLLADTENAVFNDSAYYKNVFDGGGDSAKRLNAVFQKYCAAKDPSDKTLYRQQMVSAFWDYFSNVIKETTKKLSAPKKYFLRYGMLHPGALAPESKSLFAKIIDDSGLNQPIYYIDEWFARVGRGDVKASATDEAGGGKGNENAHFKSLLEKSSGKFEGTKGLLQAKDIERAALERELKTRVEALFQHEVCQMFPDIKNPYTEAQRSSITGIQDILKNLSRVDREINRFLDDFAQSRQDVSVLEDKVLSTQAAEEASVDFAALDTEFNSLRQMAKMTIGRQGNPFPVLSADYFHSLTDNLGFRENIIKKLAWVEEADCEAFIRVYKNNPSRIVPYVILLPTYGDFGICWEPFDKHNKASSRGRIAIPMYPKNLTIAVLTAMGDFRWQVAKEVASMYWMDEGLTGNYFQWFQAQKLKGDVKLYFIQDYIMWMTKEREGVQKLDKNVRGIFWRYLPFSQPLKDKLKDRNLVYQELYQRDKNRAKSDGY